MDPRDKLKNIQEQKRKLQERIHQIDNTEISDHKNDQAYLNGLLQRKKMLEDQKKQQEKYQLLEKEYNERKKQVEREKQLERIKNQKRILELQGAMKKVIFEGLKDKVKGMNSDQLLMRGFLATDNSGQKIIKPLKSSQSSNFKEAFEDYLLKDGPQILKPKYDLNNLNEKRMEIYQKKEEAIMKQILLKQIAASDDPIQTDILSLNRQQLIEQLQSRGISIDEFMHPVKKEVIIEQYDDIKSRVQMHIAEKKKQISSLKEETLKNEKYKKQLREDVKKMNFKSLQVIKRLLYDLLDQICDQYDKRHVNRSQQDKEQISKKLQEQYDELLDRNLVEELSNNIIDQMLESMRQQMVRQSSQQICKLNEYAHKKTQECFKFIFGDYDVSNKIKQLDNYKIGLNFINENQNEISKPKNNKYVHKPDTNESNIFQTEENTTNLVNDIQLLDSEQKYIDKLQTTMKNQIEQRNDESIFVYDRQLYSVTKQHIKTVHSPRIYYSFTPPIDNIESVRKMHKHWLIRSENNVALISPWNRQEFENAMGSRISNPCGNITFSMFYPVKTLLNAPCSVMLGFQKGQMLKYNYNYNRITSKQTNITHYVPIIQHVKSGDEPAFPLDNRNYIQVQSEKAKPNSQLHEFRQFFQHHSESIVFLGFYRIDKIISIDKSLKCALWQYNKQLGISCYQPVYKFQIRSSYQIYKQDQNPRYKDIYPVSNSKQTPEEMFQKYMLTETFLKMQLYNNPKKQIAYLKSPTWDKEQTDKPIWKITYKDSKKQVNKILQSFYNVIDGKIVALQAQIQGNFVYVLCERQHIIRNDLKTVKIYSWNILERRLGRVALQIDMYKDQKINSFVILRNMIKGVDLDLALVVNSGRILLFSLISGQLLKNINDDLGLRTKQQKIYFKQIINAADKQLLYTVSTSSISELSWEDANTLNDRNKLNKIIDNVKRKYFK